MVLKQQWPAMACTSLGYQPEIISQGEAHAAPLSLLNDELLERADTVLALMGSPCTNEEQPTQIVLINLSESPKHNKKP